MELLPIDLTAVIGVVMGTSIVLIPVMALCARYTLKPLVEALGTVWGTKDTSDRVQVLERRIAVLERQIQANNEIAGLSTRFSSRSGISVD